MARIILGVSGASGTILAQRALRWLVRSGHTIHLVISKAAFYCAVREVGEEYGRGEAFLAEFDEQERTRIHLHRNHDIAAPIASGSFACDGMLLMPCSMATLAAIAMGLSDNLIRRAAEVTLKERRRLVVVPREMPFTEAHLDNMLRVTRMGAVILPPFPAWYLKPQSLEEVETFTVARACDLLGISGPKVKRWS